MYPVSMLDTDERQDLRELVVDEVLHLTGREPSSLVSGPDDSPPQEVVRALDIGGDASSRIIHGTGTIVVSLDVDSTRHEMC